ncbi:hypothetical protein CWI38_0831p0030 [Hamiltosporidium tvaerminnensis]|uniref:Uncharacterized protein n=1 Tax=Hamiltosporidium tvaerminnensis TaxID=1176355 RepID=A0A4Q9LV44_9MICR|nr:hypothetical protein CWI38_0831p0030 [Hamiltosporidium tvaerminnensis]
MILNRDNECFIETNQYGIFEILNSLVRKRNILKLEYFHPLVKYHYKITLKNIFEYQNEIEDICDTIKMHVERLSSSGNYGIGFSYNLLKHFRYCVLSIFYSNDLSIVYLKPIYLLITIWIEGVIQKDISLAKNLFYISWSLKVMKATMEYNYECLKPFMNKDVETDEQGAFSSLFCIDNDGIHKFSRLVVDIGKNIFEILDKKIICKIFETTADMIVWPSHSDSIFSTRYTPPGMPGILFDVFLFLSEENLNVLNSMICDYKEMKQNSENIDLEFKLYMKNRLNLKNYSTNVKVRNIYYDLACIYEEIFLHKFFFYNCVKKSNFSNLDLWIHTNILNLKQKIANNIVPNYDDYIGFLETCNLFLHYISKVVLNPGLTPIRYADIISKKIISSLEVNHFQ